MTVPDPVFQFEYHENLKMSFAEMRAKINPFIIRPDEKAVPAIIKYVQTIESQILLIFSNHPYIIYS